MIHTWMYGDRAYEPVSRAKPRFCGAIQAEGRMLRGGWRKHVRN